MRECEGARHIQPLLFRPVADEDLCPACRQERAETSPNPPPGRPLCGLTAWGATTPGG